ncbi:MAG: segregation/condensation protein A [Acidobacteria bacterium]|nr:segregation/condensation protein A [Acidobacteriota bacterium]NIM62882.1 segregation/condensation protein A [Acidobacteriota bacterium]NIO58825.1 segregation/condensation protein A [Acidobacteriota bacterium]NIQ29882.1 segregation/condensation protein A [Acidobacteriota bacterium]NIQ84606.1 segregation/condensation protein A [Acidobacteriota bacterium]
MSDPTPDTPNTHAQLQSRHDFRAHPVSVGEFEGPLDLLLHLVRINEVDITDIPIVPITEQYNEYLELMRELNLEIAGEYLVMAATLMHIKSRMLLPPDPQEDDEEAVDPRAELAQQLLDYQRFKQAAENLEALDSRRHLIWTREDVTAEFAGEELLVVDLFDLVESFREVLGRLDEETRLQLKRDNVSVAEKIQWLTDLLERRSSVDLLALMADLPSRLEILATFLAILEMMRMQTIVAFQRKRFGEIRLSAVREGEADGENQA